MEKKSMSIIVAIFVFVLILFLTIYFVNDNFLNKKYIEDQTREVPFDSKKEYSYGEALDSGNIKACKDIEDEIARNACEIKLSDCSNGDCFYSKALLELSIENCYGIEDDNLRQTCTIEVHTSTILRGAVHENDILICQEFQEESMVEFCENNFYFAQAKNTKDQSKCSLITSEVLRNECFN